LDTVSKELKHGIFVTGQYCSQLQTLTLPESLGYPSLQ